MESRIISLFADPQPSRRGPSGFLVSMAVHVVVMGSLYLNLKHGVRVEDEAIVHRYTVRLLSLWRPEPKVRRPVENHSTQSPQRGAGEVASGGQPSAPSLPLQVADRIPAPQTLVQPDLPPNLILPQEIPIPLILMWSPESSTARQIVLPPPQETDRGQRTARSHCAQSRIGAGGPQDFRKRLCYRYAFASSQHDFPSRRTRTRAGKAGSRNDVEAARGAGSGQGIVALRSSSRAGDHRFADGQ